MQVPKVTESLAREMVLNLRIDHTEIGTNTATWEILRKRWRKILPDGTRTTMIILLLAWKTSRRR